MEAHGKRNAAIVGEARRRLEALESSRGQPPRNEIDARSLVHELQVQHIELEMQNEELRRALLEAQQSKDKYAELFDFLPTGILVIDAEGIIRDSNFGAARILDTSRAALVGQRVTSLVAPEHRGIFKDFLSRLPAAEGITSVEVNLARYAADPDWALITGIRKQAGASDGGGFYLTLVDISERMKAQRILARDKTTVERLVEDRSKELFAAQRELEKARRLADIGELAATVAHELRNPLAAINVAAAAIRRKLDDGPVRRHVETIEKKVRESDQIINNLLFYSRLRVPHFERIDLEGILDEVAEELAAKTGRAKEFRVIWEKGSAKGIVLEADQLQIKELVTNLVNNAYDSLTCDGLVEIAAAREGPDDVLIRIRDNGAGIAGEDLTRIWKPFYSTKSKGTGLGLSVVSQIVRLHGGSVKLESEPGKGTTVSVRLPLKHESGGGRNSAASFGADDRQRGRT